MILTYVKKLGTVLDIRKYLIAVCGCMSGYMCGGEPVTYGSEF